MSLKSALLITSTLILEGCMVTSVRFSEKWVPSQPPSYEDYFDSYALGFVGEPAVDVRRACVDQTPLAFVRLKSAEDIALTVVTMGIYAPTTIRIWCGD